MPTASSTPSTPLTIGAVAKHFNCQQWQIRAAISRGFLTEPARMGCYRVFNAEDLPKIEAALVQAGYLRRREEVPA